VCKDPKKDQKQDLQDKEADSTQGNEAAAKEKDAEVTTTEQPEEKKEDDDQPEMPPVPSRATLFTTVEFEA
jgi:hypothetical protein